MAMTQPDQSRQESPTDRSQDGQRPDIAQEILDAAYRLIEEKGEAFTTQELTKEAGFALQTFYRYYESKDRLLLAVIEDMVGEYCRAMEARARLLDDPTDRLRMYITEALDGLHASRGAGGPRFITSQHWRLHQLQPEAMDAATKPFADLVQRELESARAAGTLSPRDPARDAWMIAKLVMVVFHHYAFVPDDPRVEDAAEEVWQFCLSAVGGTTTRAQPGYVSS